ncbi:MAG: hypothetical protein KIS92_19935 [Planctomycetota bacterium]|nr:hypothetical protein [Planctomycetota bacterium]
MPRKHPTIAAKPLNLYGSLEATLQGLRDHRPLDLNAKLWRKAHPKGTYAQWRKQAARCLLDGLHYEPGAPKLKPKVHGREERDGFTLERVSFNTTPWIRVNGYFLLPKGIKKPVPGMVVLHAWGGPMLWGKDRMVGPGRGREHPRLRKHIDDSYGGRWHAEEVARRGYAVIVIDAHHFGERAPRGLNGIPADLDPNMLTLEAYEKMDALVRGQLYLGVRQLNWAGTTWMGVNYWDDSRCVDYLLSRKEVDGARIGCTGLSGGAWRTNVLAGLDRRIKASASACWMTTGDHQQVYNLSGAVGTFCLLPGVWDRMDIPDLSILAAPNATMVISNSRDELFPVEGQEEAHRQIKSAFAWAGCPEKYSYVNLPKPHCYDVELQEIAFAWFERHLKT